MVFVLGALQSRRPFVEKTEKWPMSHILLGNCDCRQPAGGIPALPERHESKKPEALADTAARSREVQALNSQYSKLTLFV
jgi:hypothetical protein